MTVLATDVRCICVRWSYPQTRYCTVGRLPVIVHPLPPSQGAGTALGELPPYFMARAGEDGPLVTHPPYDPACSPWCCVYMPTFSPIYLVVGLKDCRTGKKMMEKLCWSVSVIESVCKQVLFDTYGKTTAQFVVVNNISVVQFFGCENTSPYSVLSVKSSSRPFPVTSLQKQMLPSHPPPPPPLPILPPPARLSGHEDEDPDYEELEAILHSQKKVSTLPLC